MSKQRDVEIIRGLLFVIGALPLQVYSHCNKLSGITPIFCAPLPRKVLFSDLLDPSEQTADRPYLSSAIQRHPMHNGIDQTRPIGGMVTCHSRTL